MSASLEKYSLFEAQISRVMAPLIQYMRKKMHALLYKESIRVLPYQERPKSTTSFKQFQAHAARTSRVITSCSPKAHTCRARLLKQVEKRLPKQTIESVLVVFLDICSTSLAKMIIDIDIYDNAFAHFLRKVWDVRKLLAQKTAAVNEGTIETPITTKETKSVNDTAMFDSDDDRIDFPPATEGDDEALEKERDNCISWMNQTVEWKKFLTPKSAKATQYQLEIDLKTVQGRFLHVDPLKWFKESPYARENKFHHKGILAGCNLARSDSGAFQESVFSTGRVNMNYRQTRMLPERYAKRVILHHNIKFVEKYIYKIDGDD
jgi:hypothetical protein